MLTDGLYSYACVRAESTCICMHARRRRVDDAAAAGGRQQAGQSATPQPENQEPRGSDQACWSQKETKAESAGAGAAVPTPPVVYAYVAAAPACMHACTAWLTLAEHCPNNATPAPPLVPFSIGTAVLLLDSYAPMRPACMRQQARGIAT